MVHIVQLLCTIDCVCVCVNVTEMHLPYSIYLKNQHRYQIASSEDNISKAEKS